MKYVLQICGLLFSGLAQSSGSVWSPVDPVRDQGIVAVTPYQVPFESETITLPVSKNGVQYRLTVREPLRQLKDGEKAATVYVLDTLWNFPAVASMFANAEFLGHVPPLRIVGVGYVDDVSAPMATPNCSTYGHPNCPRQDG
jgi:hypothetical protein